MENVEVEPLSVTNINGGRLKAHIDESILELMEDVIDPNKPATARREITVKIGFVPSKSRRETGIDYVVSVKRAEMSKEKSFCNVRKVGGKAFASVEMIEQPELSFEENQAN